MFETIQLKKEKNVAIGALFQPDLLNVLNRRTLADIDRMLDYVEHAPEIQALIITGSEKVFSSGTDIGAQSDLDAAGGRDWAQYGSKVFRKLEKLQIPTIAAVNGFALGGGCELAMSCDIRIASVDAKFGQPEVGLGITPGFSGTQRLPRLVGVAKAKELILTGKVISAAEAERIGLVNRVVEGDCLIAEAIEIAKEITKNAPMAVLYAKQAIDRGIEVDIDSGIAIENELFALCFSTKDQKEGMKAFIEKRTVQFRGV